MTNEKEKETKLHFHCGTGRLFRDFSKFFNISHRTGLPFDCRYKMRFPLILNHRTTCSSTQTNTHIYTRIHASTYRVQILCHLFSFRLIFHLDHVPLAVYFIIYATLIKWIFSCSFSLCRWFDFVSFFFCCFFLYDFLISLSLLLLKSRLSA